MGCLDPKLDKERTFELLKKRGAIKAELQFTGGHDEGNVEAIILTLGSGEKQELEVWYCGGYGIGEKQADGSYGPYVPLSTPENEDQELSDLLQGPIDAEFGSWGSVGYTTGVCEWDVFTGKATLTYSMEVEKDFEKEVF